MVVNKPCSALAQIPATASRDSTRSSPCARFPEHFGMSTIDQYTFQMNNVWQPSRSNASPQSEQTLLAIKHKEGYQSTRLVRI